MYSRYHEGWLYVHSGMSENFARQTTFKLFKAPTEGTLQRLHICHHPCSMSTHTGPPLKLKKATRRCMKETRKTKSLAKLKQCSTSTSIRLLIVSPFMGYTYQCPQVLEELGRAGSGRETRRNVCKDRWTISSHPLEVRGGRPVCE